ncbi:hypothetical protein H7I53_21280 [Mycolicibacterium pulveris]|uniref:Mce associated membrane protein n=1 Tax=Mycolicibacterium pulveris TaxID=36813 RepID=A0A7I7UFT1_MYCPV|nr:hypothetical protein [Mycolicibacterium pulveris]MCV6982746.1 hypothetical protein [Mycolicibacterium pulveris]BBY80324.1 hypothetical protein MPUL_14820 [Mycolicibacterium pulveris]
MTTREDVSTVDTPEDTEATTTGPETDAGSEDAQPQSDSPPRRWLRHPTRRTVALGAGAALLVASLATSAVLAVKLSERQAIDNAGQQALAAAQQYAIILTTVDGAKLDENFAAVLDGATGEFKEMYSESSNQLKQVLIDNEARADGKVIAAGIKSATKDKVEVMLFLDQAVSNKLNPEPRLDRNRIIITMDKVDGRWLASDVVLP